MRFFLKFFICLFALFLVGGDAFSQSSELKEAVSVKKDGDPAKALDLSIPLCEAGEAEACWFIAYNIRIPGEDYKIQTERTNKYYKVACADIPEACFNFALQITQYKFNVTEEDLIEARNYYELGCAGEVMKSCHNLAIMQKEGLGGETDLEKSRANFNAVCKSEVAPKACFIYGDMLRNGEGGEVNLIEARKHYALACDELGEIDACYKLAESLVNENAGPVDYSRALELFSEHCLNGVGGACTGYGAMLENGQGVLPDPALAEIKYKDGCDFGYAQGCLEYAKFLQKGLGDNVPQDNVRNALSAACDGNIADGCVAYAEYLKTSPSPGATENMTSFTIKRTYRKACQWGREDVCDLSE